MARALTTNQAIALISEKLKFLAGLPEPFTEITTRQGEVKITEGWLPYVGAMTQLTYSLIKLKKLKIEEQADKDRDKKIKQILEALGLDNKARPKSGKVSRSAPALKKGG